MSNKFRLYISLGIVFVFMAFVSLFLHYRLPKAISEENSDSSIFSSKKAATHTASISNHSEVRLVYTQAYEHAITYIRTNILSIPNVELDEKAVSGSFVWNEKNIVYNNIVNLVAKIPGKSKEAILVSVHFDSPQESFGASDNAMATGVILEVLRMLSVESSKKPFDYTIIFNFNGGEEQGLLGAHAFLNHKWAKDVRWFLNFDAGGIAGKSILFQSSIGSRWLLDRYKESVPYPHAHVLGQDIFQSGFIPSDTDFSIYNKLGKWEGLDFALYRNGYWYHTFFDRARLIPAGSYEHLGQNLSQFLKKIANSNWPIKNKEKVATYYSNVYFDVFGLFMVVYSEFWQQIFAFLSILLSLVAIYYSCYVRRVPFKHFFLSILYSCSSVLFIIVLSIVSGLLWKILRPFWWYYPSFQYIVPIFTYFFIGYTLFVEVWEKFINYFSIPKDSSIHLKYYSYIASLSVILFMLTITHIQMGYICLFWLSCGLISFLYFDKIFYKKDRVKNIFLNNLFLWIIPTVFSLPTILIFWEVLLPVLGRVGNAPSNLIASLMFILTILPFLAVFVLKLNKNDNSFKIFNFEANISMKNILLMNIILYLLLCWFPNFSFPFSINAPKRLFVTEWVQNELDEIHFKSMDEIPFNVSDLKGDIYIKEVKKDGEIVTQSYEEGFFEGSVTLISSEKNPQTGNIVSTISISVPKTYQQKVIIKEPIKKWYIDGHSMLVSSGGNSVAYRTGLGNAPFILKIETEKKGAITLDVKGLLSETKHVTAELLQSFCCSYVLQTRSISSYVEVLNL